MEHYKNENEFGSWIAYNKFLKTRTIIISSIIDREMVERVTRQLFILEAESEEPISVIVNSPGGDADAGFAIYDLLRFINPHISTVCTGLAASAGSLILLAAPKKRRLALPNARLLIHQPLGGVGGHAIDIQIQAEEFVKLKKRINKVIAEETGQPLEKVEKDTDRDHWMSAEEAKDYGLISKIVKTRSEMDKVLKLKK